MKTGQPSRIVILVCGLLVSLSTYAFGTDFAGISSPFAKTSVCKPIPDTLKLCRNISYSVMRLPNLLKHETMEEVHQQAHSWVPLLPKRCHPDLKIFLCSLFAPVCIEDAPVAIYPCRSLCEQVRDACSPVMDKAGFPWPVSLNCDQYPQNEMCIDVQCKSNCNTGTPAPVAPVCSPCDNPQDSETVLDHFCASEFVLKVKIRSIKKTKRDLKLTTERRKRVIYKQGPLRKKDLRRLSLVIRGGANCPCPQLENKSKKKKGKGKKKKKRKDFYLVMGRKLDRKLLVTVLHRWPRKQKTLNQLSKKFSENIC